MLIKNTDTFSITHEGLKEIAELLDNFPEGRPKAAALRAVANGLIDGEAIRTDGRKIYISSF